MRAALGIRCLPKTTTRHGTETTVLDWRDRLVCSSCGSLRVDFGDSVVPTEPDAIIAGTKSASHRQIDLLDLGLVQSNADTLATGVIK
jgi:hypothetical protein